MPYIKEMLIMLLSLNFLMLVVYMFSQRSLLKQIQRDTEFLVDHMKMALEESLKVSTTVPTPELPNVMQAAFHPDSPLNEIFSERYKNMESVVPKKKKGANRKPRTDAQKQVAKELALKRWAQKKQLLQAQKDHEEAVRALAKQLSLDVPSHELGTIL